MRLDKNGTTIVFYPENRSEDWIRAEVLRRQDTEGGLTIYGKAAFRDGKVEALPDWHVSDWSHTTSPSGNFKTHHVKKLQKAGRDVIRINYSFDQALLP
jgi:hypothetical protein